MSTIYDVANVKGFIRMCNDGWLQDAGLFP